MLGEKVGPSFVQTFEACWLDFQGLQLPESSKKREQKQLVRMTIFEVREYCIFINFFQTCLPCGPRETH